MGLALCLVALATTFVSTRRRLGLGVQALFAIGYLYGIVRARFPDGFSHFIFDFAAIGLYAAHFAQRPDARSAHAGRHGAFWVKALAVVPIMMFFVPLQHPLIQLVGLRAAVFFLPLIPIGARLQRQELEALARWLAGLNTLAFVFALGEFVLGVERFYPHNAVTEIIYRSTDVGEAGAMRIPATFTGAHAFGGTMLASVPLLLGHWNALTRGLRERTFMLGASLLTVMGIFMCGARLPVVLLFALATFAVLRGRFAARRKAAFVLAAIAVVLLVSLSDRFQRFRTLGDQEYVAGRVVGSANLTLLETVLEYPLGAGLARAAGTSVPYFLADLAKPHIGLENEYSRIVIEQGLIGLAIWLAFIAWTVWRPTDRFQGRWRFGYRLMRVYVALYWTAGIVGTGVLTSIPGTPFLLIFMGALATAAPATRDPGVVPAPDRMAVRTL